MRRCLVLLLLALAACGGGGDPRTAAAPPSSAAPSVAPSAPVTSVSAEVSPSPEVLRFPATKAGALAIAEAFYTEIGRADVTGDTSRYRQMIEPTCPCAKAASDIDARPAGEAHTGEVFSVVAVTTGALRPHAASMTVTFDVSPSAITAADGKRRSFSGIRHEIDAISLDGSSGYWLVVSSAVLKAGALHS